MPEDMKAMDDAAAEADKDLSTTIPAEAVKALAAWWAKHYLTAGHKRLARVLLKYADKADATK